MCTDGVTKAFCDCRPFFLARAAVEIATTQHHPCVLLSDGSLTCWGSWLAEHRPEPPAGTFTHLAAGLSDLAAGGEWSCGLRSDGSLECWGDEPGPAPLGSFRAPVLVSGHGCALRPDDTVVCWGTNATGVPNSVPPPGPFTLLAAGPTHTCGLRPRGTVVCWGDRGPRAYGSIARPP